MLFYTKRKSKMQIGTQSHDRIPNSPNPWRWLFPRCAVQRNFTRMLRIEARLRVVRTTVSVTELQRRPHPEGFRRCISYRSSSGGSFGLPHHSSKNGSILRSRRGRLPLPLPLPDGAPRATFAACRSTLRSLARILNLRVGGSCVCVCVCSCRPSIRAAIAAPEADLFSTGISTVNRHIGQHGPPALNHCRKHFEWNLWQHCGMRMGSPSTKAERQMPHSSFSLLLRLPP